MLPAALATIDTDERSGQHHPFDSDVDHPGSLAEDPA